MKAVMANMFLISIAMNQTAHNTKYLATNFSDIITNSSVSAEMCDKDGGMVHLRVSTW